MEHVLQAPQTAHTQLEGVERSLLLAGQPSGRVEALGGRDELLLALLEPAETALQIGLLNARLRQQRVQLTADRLRLPGDLGDVRHVVLVLARLARRA